MYDSLRSDGLPLASLLEFFLERGIVVDVWEDNAAAIVAAREGYSKRLRHLHRTKRIHVGYLGEIFDEENPQATPRQSRHERPEGRHPRKRDGWEKIRGVQKHASARTDVEQLPNRCP